MVAETHGQILVVPLAPSRAGNPQHCRPIGCYIASVAFADRYREDR